MVQLVLAAIIDQIAFCKYPVCLVWNAIIGSTIAYINNPALLTGLLPCMDALAVSAFFLAVCTFVRKIQLPVSFTCLNQMIGIDGDGFQPVTLQNCINGVIQTVTDDVQVNIVFFNGFYELRKKRVYRDLIQAIRSIRQNWHSKGQSGHSCILLNQSCLRPSLFPVLHDPAIQIVATMYPSHRSCWWCCRSRTRWAVLPFCALTR